MEAFGNVEVGGGGLGGPGVGDFDFDCVGPGAGFDVVGFGVGSNWSRTSVGVCI